MKKGQYETEERRWRLLLEAISPTKAPLGGISGDEQDRVKMALAEHDDATPVVAKWYDGPIRALKYTDNEGWYEDDKGGFKVKQLDKGHKFVDGWESLTNGKTLLPYTGQWKHMKILRPERFYFSHRTYVTNQGITRVGGPKRVSLMGAHGWELAAGTYMFVICRDGALRYFPNDDDQCEPPHDGKNYVQYLPHAALAEHESVLAAGNLGVQTGGIIAWAASNSGHYRVDDRMCRYNLLACLRAHGYAYNAVSDPDLAGMNLEDGEQYLCFYQYPKWREVQTAAKVGMTVCLKARPESNVVTDRIAQTLGALEMERLSRDAVRHLISSPSNNVVYNSIGDKDL